MADTTTTSAPAPSVKKYYDYAQSQVDEQAILDKYNAATLAQFNVQREQNRQAENQFYNQMYNTQQTAMDTIRQANAAAVSTGASRGVQAANELSALLGLQQESVESATELAQASRQTAQEETAAVLENVLNAYQQAVSERQALTQAGIEAASVDATQAQAQATAQQSEVQYKEYLRNLHASDPDAYYRTIAADNNATDFANMTEAQYNASVQNASQAISEISEKLGYNYNDFAGWDFGEKGSDKANKIQTELRNIYTAYGLSNEQADQALKGLTDTVKPIATNQNKGNTERDLQMKQAAISYLQSQFKLQYTTKYNTATNNKK